MRNRNCGETSIGGDGELQALRRRVAGCLGLVEDPQSGRATSALVDGPAVGATGERVRMRSTQAAPDAGSQIRIFFCDGCGSRGRERARRFR